MVRVVSIRNAYFLQIKLVVKDVNFVFAPFGDSKLTRLIRTFIISEFVLTAIICKDLFKCCREVRKTSLYSRSG